MILLTLLVSLGSALAMLVPPPAAPPPSRVADAETGRQAFRLCAVCHPASPDGRNTVGPNLFAVFGRPAGMVAGFRYSNALRNRAAAGLVWTEADLRGYLANPRVFLPGGSMAFAGIRDEQRMDDLIAYLRTLK